MWERRISWRGRGQCQMQSLIRLGGGVGGLSTGPERHGNDSHLQEPREALAAVASRLLSVSVRVGSVDMEETSLVGEDVDPWCWGLLLTVAPVLWGTGRDPWSTRLLRDSWMNQEQQSLRTREDIQSSNLEMSPFLAKMSNLKRLFWAEILLHELQKLPVQRVQQLWLKVSYVRRKPLKPEPEKVARWTDVL